MLFGINQIIAGFTTLLLIIFSSFLLTIERKKKLNKRLLFFFLLINTTYLLGYLIISNIKPITLPVFIIYYLLHTTGFLFGPVLFFYTKTIVYDDFKITRKQIIHFLLYIFVSLYVLIRLAFFSDIAERWIIPAERFIYDMVLNLQVMFYMIFSILEARKYRITIQNFYSSIKGLNFYWLNIVLFGFFFMWIIDFSHFIVGKLYDLPREVHLPVTTLSLLTNFVFAVIIFYEGLKRPEIFHTAETNEDKPKYEKYRLSKEEADSYLIKLQNFMEKEKPYLEPEITIMELSEKINMHTRHLSQIINDLLNQNFYDFINSYRIKEAIKYLTNPLQSKMTILEILYAAGFNSKSTFYKVFREYTGLTPTEYRKQKLAVSIIKS